MRIAYKIKRLWTYENAIHTASITWLEAHVLYMSDYEKILRLQNQVPPFHFNKFACGINKKIW